MRRIERDIVAGVIISKDSKILMGRGHDGSVYNDTWLIPGGGIDEGETKVRTLIREIEEEAGLDVSEYEHELVEDNATGESEKTLRDTGERVLVHMHFYTYRIYINKKSADIGVQAGDDLVKLEWVSIDKLAKYKVSPPSEALFKKLGYIQ